jgi:teichuronic acid biosynthesis glycosyltransferase TuaG
MNNLVSIITPNYNSNEFIFRAYDSILSQTHQNWEWIVVDDYSDDRGERIVNLQNKDSRIKVIQFEKNQGAAAARNAGLDLAKGNYVAFLDMDDYWVPEKLEESLKFMEENNVNFVFSNYRKYQTSTKVISCVIEGPAKVTYADLLKTCSICTSTVVIAKGLIGNTRMSSNLKRGQDYFFWLQILARIEGAWRCGEKALTLYSIGHESLSSNKLKKAVSQWDIYRNHIKLGVLPSIFYFAHYAYFGYKKYRTF